MLDTIQILQKAELLLFIESIPYLLENKLISIR